MSSNFPTSADTFDDAATIHAKKQDGTADPSPPTATYHSDLLGSFGDAIEALENSLLTGPGVLPGMKIDPDGYSNGVTFFDNDAVAWDADNTVSWFSYVFSPSTFKVTQAVGNSPFQGAQQETQLHMTLGERQAYWNVYTIDQNGVVDCEIAASAITADDGTVSEGYLRVTTPNSQVELEAALDEAHILVKAATGQTTPLLDLKDENDVSILISRPTNGDLYIPLPLTVNRNLAIGDPTTDPVFAGFDAYNSGANSNAVAGIGLFAAQDDFSSGVEIVLDARRNYLEDGRHTAVVKADFPIGAVVGSVGWSLSSTSPPEAQLFATAVVGQTTPLLDLKDENGNDVFTVGPDGVLNFGADVNLYRSQANVLKTDDTFFTTKDVYVQKDHTAAQVFIGEFDTDVPAIVFSTSFDTYWLRAGSALMGTNGGIRFDEHADFSAPADTKATLYARDAGGGKTELVVRFPTGAVQVIKTEP